MFEGGGATASCLFERDGAEYLPTLAAQGPWQQGLLHGGAVGALLAGLLEQPNQVLVRAVIDLLAPVPGTPLQVVIEPATGGRRVMRQVAVLYASGQPVARAVGQRMRCSELNLPPQATDHPTVFDPEKVPALDVPNRRAVDTVGWESFDSLAMATRPEERSTTGRRRMWMRLLLPVVPGRPPSPVEGVVAAADFGSSGISSRLDFRSWSFMNADLVVGLSRPPVGNWVGLDCDGLVSRVGTGQAVAALYDAAGPLGHSSQSVLIEPRSR